MEKDSKIKPSGSWVPSLDGLRALSCLSLVLLHTQIIAPATKHPDDPVFKTLRQHPIAGIHKFLGCQVLLSFFTDLFFRAKSNFTNLGNKSHVLRNIVLRYQNQAPFSR